MITDVRKIDIGWALRYHTNNFNPAIKWCRETFAPQNGRECPFHGEIPFSYELHRDYVYLTFGRECDIILFLLRWS